MVATHDTSTERKIIDNYKATTNQFLMNQFLQLHLLTIYPDNGLQPLGLEFKNFEKFLLQLLATTRETFTI